MVESYPRNQKSCKRCGVMFRVKPSHYDKRVFCSKPCMAADYRERMVGANNPNYRDAGRYTCQICGAAFQSYNQRKFCSKACAALNPEARRLSVERIKTRWAAKPWPMPAPPPAKPKVPHVHVSTKVDRSCVVCGATFQAYRNHLKKTCGDVCSSRWQSIRQKGARSHLWQGGKTTAAVLRRTSVEYKTWRTAVFTRDKFTCQMCHVAGKRLAAHHILRVADMPELIYEIKNGIALCWPCHRSIHWKEAAYAGQFAAYTGLELRPTDANW